MRFLDDILRDKEIPVVAKMDYDGVPVIDCNEVAKYYWQETDQEYWEMEDFPCIAPPFEEFWLDFEAPKFVVSERFNGELRPWPSEFPRKWGFLCMGGELTPDIIPTFLDMSPWSIHRQHFEDALNCVPNIKWGLDIHMDVQLPNHEGGVTNSLVYYIWRLLILEDGRVARDHAGVPIVSACFGMDANLTIDYYVENGLLTKSEIEERIFHMALPLFHNAMMAISFMHCSNVTLTDVVPPVKSVHNKAQKRRGEKPYKPVPHKVLAIEPMKQILRSTQQKNPGTGSKKAWHMCRGYFADYRNGRGLFGKYKKLVFFGPHGRGSHTVGTTTHDYQIKLDSTKDAGL